MEKKSYHETLQSLHRSLNLHLTGSHFFGTAHQHSDVDFFIDTTELDVEEIKVTLESLGFVNITSRYTDSNITSVYRFIVPYYPNRQIDVQIVKDAEKKKRIQNLFKEKGVTNPTRAMWELAYSLMS